MLEDQRREGLLRSWVYTSSENVGSQRGIERAGFLLDRPLAGMLVGDYAIPLPRIRDSPAG